MESRNSIVQVTVKRMNDTRVEITSSCRDHFDESSLAEEIETTVTEAWAVMKEKYDIAIAEQGIVRPEADAFSPWMNEVLRNLENVESRVDSRKGFVSAYMATDMGLFIEFHNNAVRRKDLSTYDLECEVNEAINSARRAISIEINETIRSIRK